VYFADHDDPAFATHRYAITELLNAWEAPIRMLTRRAERFAGNTLPYRRTNKHTESFLNGSGGLKRLK
jgi:hypothetical protein